LKISHLIQWSNFNLAWPWHRIGAAFHPGDGLIHVLDFPKPETGNQFPDCGERSIDDRTTGTIECNSLSLRGRLKAISVAQDAGIAKLVIKFANCFFYLSDNSTRFLTNEEWIEHYEENPFWIQRAHPDRFRWLFKNKDGELFGLLAERFRALQANDQRR